MSEYVIFVNYDVVRDSDDKSVKITKDQCDYITVEKTIVKHRLDGCIGFWACGTKEMTRIVKQNGNSMEIGKDYYYWISNCEKFCLVKIVEFVKTVK
jgi:hypothetical protein